MRRPLSFEMRSPTVLVVVALAAWSLACAGPAQARKKTSPQQAARAAVGTLAGTVRHSGLRRRERRRIGGDLRRAARSVRGRRACAALVAVAEVRTAAAGIRRRAKRRALLGDARAANRALRRLRATRHCGPRVRRIKVKRVRPRYNPSLPPGPPLHEQGGEDDYKVPRDRHSKPVPPQGPPTEVGAGGAAPLPPAAGGNALSSTVTDPLQLLTNADVGPLGTAYPQEPQVAKQGSVILYSGNTNGSVSVDAGTHWTNINPNIVFGNDPGPICCDTVVRYAPSIDRFLWLMQYWCPPPKSDCSGPDKSNRYRLAVISPAQLRADGADPTRGWQVYDLTAKRYGSSTWFDYPDMAVGSRNLYLTWDLVGVGTAVSRIPLAELTSGRTLDVSWFRGENIFYRVAQNPTTTAYFVHNDTDSREAGYVWNDFLPWPFAVSLPHATRPNFLYSAITPGGIQNWNDRAGSPIDKGATIRGSELWLAWSTGRWFNATGSGVTWPQPHIQYDAYDTSDLFDLFFGGTLGLRHEGFIWSPTTAYTNPVLATNSEGDVGITFVGGDSHSMPTPYVGVLTNRSEVLRAIVSLGPATAVVGDYAGLQPDSSDPAQWVAANVFTTRDPYYGFRDHWLYTRFGRSPAPPPAKEGLAPTQIAVTGTTGTTYACCFVKDEIHVTGKLNGAPGGSSVRLEYIPPSGTGLALHETVTADADGNFSGHFTPGENQAGQWTIIARYDGAAGFAPAESDPFYQYIQAYPI
jgi:hypothetical protein